MRTCLATEVFTGIQRLWANSPDALEALSGEGSPLKPEQKAALREVAAAAGPTPEHRQRLHESIATYADKLGQVQTIVQRLRGPWSSLRRRKTSWHRDGMFPKGSRESAASVS
mmetsp:Transcript_34436/g.55721  ORF Transcript_34436/g.55721 Transcript_34436/m.55721 type:complete len:113 (-) Transcript_34436:74-412(-)